MNSMTGYGSSQTKNRQLELEIQVKSVNGRFLEVRFHLPKEHSPFENDLRKTVSEFFKRGTVDVYVHRRPATEARLKTVNIRRETAQYWAKALRALAKDLNVSSDLQLREILQMPFVIEHQEKLSLLPGELKLLEGQLKKASMQCSKLRQKEGAGLKLELLALISELEARVREMTGWRAEALKHSEQRLKSRLASLKSEEVDPSRLALETALMTDKMDVHEEIVRLGEHLKACRKLIQSSNKDSEPQGKKLDFYCQELLREVNTIGSKSQLATLTHVVVRAKAVIEKFREQVQNIE